jgi:murein DD-endopeptidase MepM/ murein hydrolase activator NlpD
MSTKSEEKTPPIDMAQIRASAESPLWSEEKSRLTYSLPVPTTEDVISSSKSLAQDIPEDQKARIGPLYTLPSPDSHVGPFKSAIDFAVEDGTIVIAAQDGVVFAIEEDNDKWGPTEEYASYLNYITLQHPSGEFSEYAHLAQGSASSQGIRVGSHVRQGQRIGITGKTGWTDQDHLHFLIFRLDQGTNEYPNTTGFKSLVPTFED